MNLLYIYDKKEIENVNDDFIRSLLKPYKKPAIAGFLIFQKKSYISIPGMLLTF